MSKIFPAFTNSVGFFFFFWQFLDATVNATDREFMKEMIMLLAIFVKCYLCSNQFFLFVYWSNSLQCFFLNDL